MEHPIRPKSQENARTGVRRWLVAASVVIVVVLVLVGPRLSASLASRARKIVETVQVRSPWAVPPSPAPDMCGRTGSPPATYAHVVLVWMQNHTPSEVYASPSAPFINDLAGRCGLATDYHWLGHPTFASVISGNELPSGCTPPGCMTQAVNIFSELEAAGKSWRAYIEDLPVNCSPDSGPLYTPEHNPPIYYTNLSGTCPRWDVPMGNLESGALHDDIVNAALPDFAFLTPNLCHDTHDCELGVGDRWLSGWIGAMAASSTYEAGRTAIFVVWDDSGRDPPGIDDCEASDDPDCLAPLVVVSPSTHAGTRSATRLNHYSLLRTIQELLGLPGLLGGAGSAPSFRQPFNL
jgi:phosphatidylinositol-3-phosphatase